ncbi:hypothetical protein PCAR4_40062 [Paraburkholderia caribensis]|nr:hypothetical protein PCAR4_40062 [Paraburkholderia caribensis]
MRSRTQRAMLSPHLIGLHGRRVRRSRIVGGIAHGIAAAIPVPYRCDLRIADVYRRPAATSQGTAQSGRPAKARACSGKQGSKFAAGHDGFPGASDDYANSGG